MENAATPLADIRDRIARTAQIAGRKAQDITLIAISKTHPAAAIAPLNAPICPAV